MSTDGRGGILVVCAANVCRSPMAEFALRRSFTEHHRLDGVSVTSAGVRADPSHTVCDDVAVFRDEPAWRQMASQHRPRPLDPDHVRQAVLVVTATRELRSSVVAAIPECRSRVFTLREAVWLGAGYVREARLSPAGSVVAFQQHIDALRGLRPLPTRPSRRPWRRAERDPLDIVDGHGGRGAGHFAAMRAALAGADELAALIAGTAR